MISIDVISVDKQSRVTLTKKVKKVIPLEPGDNISIYQDIYNKNIILKVQKCCHQHQQENKIENWILTIKKEDDEFLTKKDKSINKKTKSNPSSSDISLINKIKRVLDNTKSQGFASSVSNRYTPTQKQDTLYSTPIILVDDDSDVLFNFNRILKDERYKNVKTFSNSKNLLKHLFSLDSGCLCYKMVVIDIRMPEVNGIQLYQILKILNPSIKLFLSLLWMQ